MIGSPKQITHKLYVTQGLANATHVTTDDNHDQQYDFDFFSIGIPEFTDTLWFA